MPDNTQPIPSFSPQQYIAAARESFFYNDRSFGLEKRWMKLEVAKNIELSDPQQLVFIVDWDSEISFAPLKQEAHNAVCVWQTSDYKSTYEQHLARKELSEKERQQSYRYIELRDSLRKKVVRQFFTTGVDNSNKKLIEDMVDKLIQSRSEVVAKQFQLDFRDLLQADHDLTECLKRNKIK